MVPFVAYWTARTAQAKGRSPWLWGGAAFVLGIPWPGINLPILGVVPVLFLMFFVRPAVNRGNEERTACSKCASPHNPGQNFCTKCGWDLSREYSPETTDTILASEMHQPQASTSATLERPAETGVPDAPGASVQVDEPAIAREAAQPDSVEAMAPEERGGETTGADAPEQPQAAPEPAAEPAPQPWGMPVPGAAPTAEGMTARGEALLSEGKLQEAIDQFTKAIGLDPKHREAFEKRAEAYSRQGRQERADEDYRQVQTLSAGL